MSETITIPVDTFHRMNRALLSIEKFLHERKVEKDEWLSEEDALRLLGCSKRKLYSLKGTSIRYKAIGRKHQYSRKSIEKYIETFS
jgi:hypothetical protein